MTEAGQSNTSTNPAANGRSDDTWRSLRLRKVREAAEPALDCAINSYLEYLTTLCVC